MLKLNKLTKNFSNIQPHKWLIDSLGLKSNSLIFNPSIPEMYQIAIAKKQEDQTQPKVSDVSSNGAFCSYSKNKSYGMKKTYYVVKDSETDKLVNWNAYNIPMNQVSYSLVEQLAIEYLNHKGNCIVVDGYIGWDMKNRLKVRTFCQKSYHALFMHNMLIKPTQTQLLQDFSKGVDINIFNASQLSPAKSISNINSDTLQALSLPTKSISILGTDYAPAMKHSLYKFLQYYYPRKNILPLTASAIVNGKNNKNSILMFGLENYDMNVFNLINGKMDRKYVGNGQICWGDNGIWNVQGGCYTKIRVGNNQVEEDIKGSIRYGALVQNAIFYPNSRNINYYDIKQTKDTTTSFPLSFMKNPHTETAPEPSTILFMTTDSSGTLPPIYKLTPEQALYHFLSGYTTKINQLDQNGCIKPPQIQFNQCFGQEFLTLNTSVYAKMFYDKIVKAKSDIWVVNGGWVQGKYAEGRRLEKQEVQNLVEKVINGQLNGVSTHKSQYFNFQVPDHIEGVEDNMLYPERGWVDKALYDQHLSKLVIYFAQNFHKKFKGKLGDIEKIAKKGAPTLI